QWWKIRHKCRTATIKRWNWFHKSVLGRARVYSCRLCLGKVRVLAPEGSARCAEKHLGNEFYAFSGAGGSDCKKFKIGNSRKERQDSMTPPASVTSAQNYVSTQPLTPEELRKIDAYWRAANYLSVGQIYLYANPLLREPLKIEH